MRQYNAIGAVCQEREVSVFAEIGRDKTIQVVVFQFLLRLVEMVTVLGSDEAGSSVSVFAEIGRDGTAPTRPIPRPPD